MWWRSTSKKRRSDSARVAAAEAVGAERGEVRIDVLGDELRTRADVVGRGDDRRVAVEQAPRVTATRRVAADAAGSSGSTSRASRASSVKLVTLNTSAATLQSCCEQLRGSDHFAQDRSRPEQAHAWRVGAGVAPGERDTCRATMSTSLPFGSEGCA